MLKVQKAAYCFVPDWRLFSDVSFTIAPGEVWHLQGENGAGKTTLLRALMGLLDMQCTHVSLFDDENIRYFRAHTSYLGVECGGVFSHLSAVDNLKCLRLQKVSDNQVKALLQKWGFSHSYLQERLRVEHFSTGMKKRLSCARLELDARPLWLLDEPTHGLDQKGCQLLEGLIQQHQKKEGLVLFTSHRGDFSKKVATHTLSV